MNGERPQMPNGEMPQMPEGMEDMSRPENMGGMMGNFVPNAESSNTFTITKGGNQFSNVAPATK